MSFKIWFWQRIISPHMAGLAAALAQNYEVVYVAERCMSDERSRQGWTQPNLGRARLELASTKDAVHTLVKSASSDAIHICQGIRSNGLVGQAQRALAERCLRQWVVMETVDDSGLKGFVKRFEYKQMLRYWNGKIEGVLAIGHTTSDWIVNHGMPGNCVFPFAYFLPVNTESSVNIKSHFGSFCFVFVGQFIPRKRLDLLISSLATLKHQSFKLVVIGSGPLENELRDAANETLPGRVEWIGQLSGGKVPEKISQADCLVLPSRHDGWGAVVSEALMVGTPVICSDACGSSGIVRASSAGGVFRSGDAVSLAAHLNSALEQGRLSDNKRRELVSWAKCLGAAEGANYLSSIIQCSRSSRVKPIPPWCNRLEERELS